ncbi:MAG: polyprenyl synthetase family protein [Solirubrobacteraceae bacterium]
MSAAGALDAVLDAGGAAVPRLMERVEDRMAALARGHGALLARHAGDTIAAGGKRLRPLLVCLAAGAPPPETDGLVAAAVAVELVHGATLVHDDVLDGASLRRGRPTVIAVGGRELATATGDLLLSRAFAQLAAAGSVAAVRVLSRASSQLALGELMQRADAWKADVTVQRYLERCRLKTAVLFAAACELGALEGGGDREALAAFGEQVGLAFQILDDVLDVTGPPERTGKPQGADLLDGTVTLPLILARERDPALAALDVSEIRTATDALGVCERIAATGALATAKERALEFVACAKTALPALPQRQRGVFEIVADGVVERYA